MSIQSTQPNPAQKESSGGAFYAGRGVGKTPMITHAKGIFFWDTEGKRYLDGSSGAVAANIGHGNERVRDAMLEQASRFSYVVRTAFTSESTETLCKMVADLAGPGFDQTFLVSGGSEAIEATLKLARQYAVVTGQPKRSKVLARLPGYHGSTMGAAAVTGDPDRDEMFGPMMRIMPKVPAPLSYRLPEGFDVDSYAEYCANELERQILAEGEDTVLAFIMEPVGGVATGALVAPDHYYKKVREICDRYGVLLIFDEVMCGAGRTGTFLAAHHWPDALPDLVACAKGLSAGYTPLGAMIAPNRIVDKVVESGGFLHGHTYSGNPLSSAIGVAVLTELMNQDLMRNAQRLGLLLRQRLNTLKDRTDTIGDVRGMGLLNAVEIVKDKATKEIFPVSSQASYRVSAIARDLGLHIYGRRAAGGKFGEWFMAAPPLIITEQEIDLFTDLLTETFRIFEGEIR
ncbi:aminotransferase class III-fold pyridoxal phosphate-dependent enzyme [Sinorhizobium medicae]|uniref:aminotransferase family protein n=1 Tax=Sinorhizobium medicae TaxID=110321 RepID=UPI0012962504|nr:aminotransferase class III-fold pyridoxal phosphate-dependent enzyme [Sinorhizobium medicae]MDX1017328.1 aminotransferase class III-fold pyridoxal phosphate-dependent enzyme [Sinorhizobium medicae]MDX2388422.1 aminotransferase class III-fold pyridoxal phosphate-dependent enzyme [Sinorhizobium medicae]MQU75321.1 aminotransferase class III-fold pyridoxal phosphate-dependent enzyme [Sinorhizobium medicae]MQU75326.1 aminotransferase class III-fold pyridoxal phosphate-dependent enzyme [Sinorhizob